MAGVKGRSGPRPKPTKLLVLQGTVRKDRHINGRSGEPDVRGDGSLPPPPEHIPDDVRATWIRVGATLKFKIFSEEDVVAFEQFMRMLTRWSDLNDHLDENGITCESEGKDGRITIKTSPQASLWSDLNGKLMPFYSRFGMTPSDRTRVREVSGSSNAKKENPDDEFAAS